MDLKPGNLDLPKPSPKSSTERGPLCVFVCGQPCSQLLPSAGPYIWQRDESDTGWLECLQSKMWSWRSALETFGGSRAERHIKPKCFHVSPDLLSMLLPSAALPQAAVPRHKQRVIFIVSRPAVSNGADIHTVHWFL